MVLLQKVLPWIAWILAVIALFVLYKAENRGLVGISNAETLLGLSAIALLLFLTRGRSLIASNFPKGFLPKTITGAKTAWMATVAILISFIWLFIGIELQLSLYLIVVPFIVLFFGGGVFISLWLAAKILGF